jgi:hypothetical protein
MNNPRTTAFGADPAVESREGCGSLPSCGQSAMTSRLSLAQYLANLDTGLNEQESEAWLQAMRDACGKD